LTNRRKTTDNTPDMATQSPLYEAARAWVSAGFAVFPCAPGQKVPAIAGGNGLDDATTNLDQIDQWWTDNPQYNIGVSPSRSAMFALDVDPPLGADTLKALEQQHGLLPSTLTIQTPRGGLHYWFTGSCPSSVAKLGPKLDTRGVGGYVLVPPSIVNGVEYTYANEVEDIAEAPAWIASALADLRDRHEAAEGIELDLPANMARARALLRSYVEAGNVAHEGDGGDSKTYQVACEVLNLGLSPEGTYEVMWEDWAPHCVPFNPDWFSDFLKTKIANATEYAQNEIGAWAVPADEKTFAHVAAMAPDGTNHSSPRNRSKFYPRDEGEQDSRPAPTWLIPDLLPDEATAVMFGAPDSYKSFLALDLSLILAAGIPGWSNGAQDPMTVVYVAGEGARSIERQRRPAWRMAHGISEPLPFYTIDSVPMIVRPQEVIELIEAIKARSLKPKLLVIDTLARAMAGKNENDAKDTSEFIEAIDTIKRVLKCTVLVLHHTGKEEGRGMRGSSAIGAAVDTVLQVKSNREKRLVEVRVTRQKDADLPKVPWTFRGDAVEGSLVFTECDTATYQAETHIPDPLGPGAVGEALRALNAVSEASAVTTRILAGHLCPDLPNDDAAAKERAITGFAKRLGAAGGGKLSSYARRGRWFIPHLDGL
jgi:hypothetical protein